MTAYVRQMPVLEAERSLKCIQETAAGSGTMDEQDQKQLMHGLRHAATGGRVRAERATSASLALIGIGVETVE